MGRTKLSERLLLPSLPGWRVVVMSAQCVVVGEEMGPSISKRLDCEDGMRWSERIRATPTDHRYLGPGRARALWGLPNWDKGVDFAPYLIRLEPKM